MSKLRANVRLRKYAQLADRKRSHSDTYTRSTTMSTLFESNNSPPHLSLEDTVSISTVFHPGSQPQPDSILSSSDGVLFYVHSPTLVQLFPNVFRHSGFAPLSDPMFRDILFPLDIPANELNVMLHALYRTSAAVHSPGWDTLLASVDRMPTCNITPNRLILPSTPIHELLLSYASLKPLELYALGAFYDIHSLAVSSSSYLLSYDIATITDRMAERIGAIHLKKLMVLHMERSLSFRAILLSYPLYYPSTIDCAFQDQCRLNHVWALIAAYLVWDSRADLSIRSLKLALDSPENLTCDVCRQVLQDRIKNVLARWSSVKRTI
ncbi:hypothetical protein BDN70DRAFT_851454 [Pholiota conissans]|uniref:BTB domain-containing protein n=1 Tax=Pholiota conissans TaxID=109636 RepID=A0A9P6D4K5_9AGAR|nr:hypothetical protein BDN70DRAFT_851454 [Pholiota conissans]